jgi:hypothetical protein
MRRLVAALCFAFAMSAQASSYTSEISDLWYAPGEDGWGVNIVVQNNIAFATFYVYDVNRNPVWFTAVLSLPATGFVWSGSLFADRGPWYGGPYNSATVTERTAGTATFDLTDLNNATLTYTIDGVTVVKAMQRLTFANENYSGTYAGGYSVRSTGCVPSNLNGLEEVSGYLTVTHTGTAFHIATSTTGLTCNFNGTYVQYGKLGQVEGAYTCSDGTAGSFSLFEMTPTMSGFVGQAVGQNQYCHWSGFMGGISRAQ